MASSLKEAQIALEELMAQKGSDRFDKTKQDHSDQGDTAGFKPHQKLIRGAMPEVAKGLDALLDQMAATGGKTHQGVLPLRNMDTALVAFIGLTSMFNAVSAHHDVRRVAKAIGSMVEEELWLSSLLAEDPKVWARIFKSVKRKHATVRNRKKAISAYTRVLEKDWERWDDTKKIKVGEPVLNAVLSSSGLFVLTEDNHVELSAEAKSWISDTEEIARWMKPVFLPMIVMPRPWKSQYTGAYLTKRLSDRVPLVRTYDPQQKTAINSAIRSGALKPTMEAMNAIQETPYRINTRIMEMVQWAFENHIPIDEFPQSFLLDPIEFPEEFDDLPKDQKRHLIGKKRALIVKNRSIESNALSLMGDLNTAKTLSEYPTFYLPHNMDFRGRVYPIPHFNQQREDHVRAMIEFEDGKPLGKHGEKWLAIHLANVGDFGKISKRPLQERYNWTLDNEANILETANDPKTNLWWTLADKPFQFLAACFEWAEYRRQGPKFPSRIPIALDGSNSGLQHYSAALRAEADGRLVNLTAEHLPQDVYQAVADRVRELVEGDLHSDLDADRDLAERWLAFGIDRKVVKRNVMTFAYSSETYGFKQQLQTDLMQPLSDQVLEGKLEEHPFGDDEGFAAATYLAKKVWAAVNEVVANASVGMKFFQQIASILAHERKEMIWETPVGFPVVHKYNNWQVKEVEIFLLDRRLPVVAASTKDVVEGDDVFRRIKMNIRTEPEQTIKKSKQKSAVAPNVIHSMDAAHLLLTVLAAKNEGITHFSLIHDSFATHAADTERFFYIIREEFVKMYEEFDIFYSIWQRAYGVLSEEGRKRLPSLPTKGELDLREVINSDYAFS